MAGITEVCEAVTQGTREWWGPSGNDSVTRDYRPDLNPNKSWPAGRKVYVGPLAYAQTGIADRGTDIWDYEVEVVVAEQCDESTGDPTKEWVDERIDFADGMYKVLGDVRREKRTGGLLKGLVCQTAEVRVVYDAESLREMKRFFSQLVFTYRRLETG
jgi:hypothetical protein